MTPLKAGDPVQFIGGSIGLMEDIHATQFVDEVVRGGDSGVYVGRHPNRKLDRWHVVKVNKNGRELVCPCFEGQFVKRGK
jgi:hypothetical protein